MNALETKLWQECRVLTVTLHLATEKCDEKIQAEYRSFIDEHCIKMLTLFSRILSGQKTTGLKSSFEFILKEVESLKTCVNELYKKGYLDEIEFQFFQRYLKDMQQYSKAKISVYEN